MSNPLRSFLPLALAAVATTAAAAPANAPQTPAIAFPASLPARLAALQHVQAGGPMAKLPRAPAPSPNGSVPWLEQDVFARSMLNLARFCTSMWAADLLELAQKLTLTSKGAFRSINDDLSGSVSVAYDVQVSAKVDSGTTTKNIDVPSSISFNLPMLLGGSPVSINADLLYRIPDEAGGKIKLGIRLPDRVYVERDVLEALVAQLSTDTELAVAVGSSDVPDLPGDFS